MLKCSIETSTILAPFSSLNLSFFGSFQPRTHARRLIHGVLVNHEYDLLEARVNMLKDVVDVFVLQVSKI